MIELNVDLRYNSSGDFMKIVSVREENLLEAAYVHSEAWKDSHRSFCTAEFVEKHTVEAQAEYLRREILLKKQVWMLIDDIPVGIVSRYGNRIENLYVLPERQRRGYGKILLSYAIEQGEKPCYLSVLNTNGNAKRLYERMGFAETRKQKRLNDRMYEIEMILRG